MKDKYTMIETMLNNVKELFTLVYMDGDMRKAMDILDP